MLYVIWATDAPNSWEKRKATRPAHIERMKPLLEAGRVVLAGPMPAVDSPEPGDAGMTGSLIVLEFDSLEAATEWANADPYVKAGVYTKVEVKPFIQALP